MHFYSGFSLRNEADFFSSWLERDEYSVSGFSYGAIKALEFACESTQRIERLQLFSPAYFCNKTEAFRRMQLKGYRRDSSAYRARFIESCFAPYATMSVETADDGEQALEKLLYYEWSAAQLEELVRQGVRIEVYLGEKDFVIDAKAVKAFFAPYATVYFIKGANHFLQGENFE